MCLYRLQQAWTGALSRLMCDEQVLLCEEHPPLPHLCNPT